MVDLIKCGFANRVYQNPFEKCEEEKKRMDAADNAYKSAIEVHNKTGSTVDLQIREQKAQIFSITNDKYIKCLTDDPSFFDKLKKFGGEIFEWLRDHTKITGSKTDVP